MEVDFFKNSQNATIYQGVGRTRLLNECSEFLCLNYSIDSSEIFPFLNSQKEITKSHNIIASFIANEDFTLSIHQKLKKLSPFFHISHITETLQTGQVLSYKELNGVALALELIKKLIRELSEDQIPLFNITKSKLKALLDSKSFQVQKIQKKVTWFLGRNTNITSSLQDLDFFDGTYLLPVKSSEYETHIGVIEKRSNTGGTFYVSLDCLNSLNSELK